MVQRWQKYVDEGVFRLSVPLDTQLGGGGEKGKKAEFWTTPYPYWEMEMLDGELVSDLKRSGLVIFKVREASREEGCFTLTMIRPPGRLELSQAHRGHQVAFLDAF